MNISLVFVTKILRVLITYEVFLDWYSITEVKNAISQNSIKRRHMCVFIVSINKEEW